ncbi:hypothetical protein C1H46_043185 [Malus baccata]|uniref:CCHC-type domain-containing protein n=1 Tax=Malus baccata TaxID=106549 RepID=A0A540KAP8_MALBA|nr:hypothetical protein C1H46_043185 [Malus baccata]
MTVAASTPLLSKEASKHSLTLPSADYPEGRSMSGRLETTASPLVMIPASSVGNRGIRHAIVMPPAEEKAVVGIMENGGCSFFEWCDNAASGPNAMATTGRATRSHSYAASDSSFRALECPCGGGVCLILTAKTGKNIGNQFYRCPAKEGSFCGFFKWCNEHTAAAAGVPGRGAKVQYGLSEANNKGYVVTTGSSCFKCGKEGHWARDCPTVPSYNAAPAEMGARSASGGSCYKCGKPGHWARDCPSS